ncbi:uncharacterized protein P884DRAFT_254875 [Thermothelomyces heterothallicus CBS 202.75]|uniref:uncharacterized protein n=1 Tax=Thermothelomyces heterothallicus CBS 202.75 TaxID=1149848 RepID=UPI0037437811
MLVLGVVYLLSMLIQSRQSTSASAQSPDDRGENPPRVRAQPVNKKTELKQPKRRRAANRRSVFQSMGRYCLEA